mgnify:CR=1 FL=1
MQRTETGAADPYPEPIDAIVLAGTDDNPKRLIRGSNKAFLEIGGQVLVRRVVEALLDATTIGQVFVVGPSGRLRDMLQGLPEGLGRQVTVVQQGGKMLANAWKAIDALEVRYHERHGTGDPQRPLLFVSSDLPLISAAAVDDFVRRCAREDRLAASGHSMLAGVAEEASLRRFYPEHGKAGIERPFVHLDDYRLRLANIYVGRPRTLSEQQFLQTGFDHRKAEKWKNVLALAWKFLAQPGGLRAARITLRLQATLLAARRGGRLYHKLRSGNRRDRVEQACGEVIGGSVRMVITPFGELSLDVDNDKDYLVLSQRFDDWQGQPPIFGPGARPL